MATFEIKPKKTGFNFLSELEEGFNKTTFDAKASRNGNHILLKKDKLFIIIGKEDIEQIAEITSSGLTAVKNKPGTFKIVNTVKFAYDKTQGIK